MQQQLNENQLNTFLPKIAKPFDSQNAYDMKFDAECLFAKQQILNNDFIFQIAQNNQPSLRNAILNVAAVGISLNPAMAHAYLVPREGSICLDVSYRGLVKLATDTGSIEWAKAVLVYEGDNFTWQGPAEPPKHEADVFNSDRIDAEDPLKNLKGGYCIAKLPCGGFIVDTMTAGEILTVRDSSKAYTKGKIGKKGPWEGKWAGEMAKKTLVKRASKSWPQSNDRERLDRAIEVVNQHEGLREERQIIDVSDYLQPSQEQTDTYLELAKGDTVDFWIWYSQQDERIKVSLPGCDFPKGQKGKMMTQFNAAIEDGRKQLDQIKLDSTACCVSQDEHGLREIFEELPENQINAVLDSLPMEHVSFAKGVSLEDDMPGFEGTKDMLDKISIKFSNT